MDGRQLVPPSLSQSLFRSQTLHDLKRHIYHENSHSRQASFCSSGMK